MADTETIATKLMGDLQRDYGLNAEQAAGVVGNLMHESGGFNSLQEIKPLVPGSKGGYGYAQWTGPRRKSFESYVENQGLDPTSYEANYGFLKHELQSDPYERKQFLKVKNAKTAEEAARLISQNYLRPGIPHTARRISLANQALGYAGQPAPVQPGGIPGALGGIGAHMGKLGQGALGMFGAPGLMKAGPQKPGNLMAFAAPVMRKAQASIVPNLMGSVAGRTILGKHLMGQNIAPAPAMVPGHRGGGTQAIAINAQGSKPVTLMRAATGRGSNQSQAFDSQYHGGQSMDVYRANRAAAGGPITQASINAALGSGRTMVKAKPRYVSSRGDGYSGGTPQSLVG